MKVTILVLASLVSLTAFACEGEGQLWPTKVVDQVINGQSCRVIPAPAQMDANPFCVLDDQQVFSEGIEVGVDQAGQCKVGIGAEISGPLSLIDGVIYNR